MRLTSELCVGHASHPTPKRSMKARNCYWRMRSPVRSCMRMFSNNCFIVQDLSTDTPDKVAVIAGFLGWMTSPLKSEEMWTAKRGDARV
jgi:hypothetical protein